MFPSLAYAGIFFFLYASALDLQLAGENCRARVWSVRGGDICSDGADSTYWEISFHTRGTIGLSSNPAVCTDM